MQIGSDAKRGCEQTDNLGEFRAEAHGDLPVLVPICDNLGAIRRLIAAA